MLAILICTSGFNQQVKDHKPQLTKKEYLEKTKKQKTIGWISLGIGQALLWTGVILNRGEYEGEEWDVNSLGLPANPHDVYENDKLKNTLETVGIIIATSSIPFFIAAAKNKKKANRVGLNLKFEKSAVLRQTGLNTIHYPVLSFRIGLQ